MDGRTHEPVLLREVLAALACRPGGFWVDGTVGAGGHAEAILRASAPDGAAAVAREVVHLAEVGSAGAPRDDLAVLVVALDATQPS